MELFKIAVLLFLIGSSSSDNNPLKVIAQWKTVDYKFPNKTTRQEAIDTGKWIPGKPVLFDADVYYEYGKPKIFVTMPKFRQGTPITLGTVSEKSSSNGPLIVPYPNYSWHSSNCNGITSVLRITIDKCNRLWVLDTGKIGEIQYCEPQILVFNLKTDTLLRRYRFPAGIYKSTSRFITPIVDVRDLACSCVDTMLYIADSHSKGIVMYSYKNNNSWRAENKLMYLDPRYRKFHISGETFYLNSSVGGMAVSGPIGPKLASKYSTETSQLRASDRFLYFHATSADTENAVPLRYLDDKGLWDTNVKSVPHAFIKLGSRGIQSAAQAIDRNGNLFFGLMTPNAIACWNPNLPYSKQNLQIVAEDELKLQFPSGVKVVTNACGNQELWIVTGRTQKTLTGSMNYTEINFRIQAAPVTYLLNGATRCRVSNMNRSLRNKYAFNPWFRRKSWMLNSRH